jgi:hypothetical protein
MSEFGIRQRGEGQVPKRNGCSDELGNKIIEGFFISGMEVVNVARYTN